MAERLNLAPQPPGSLRDQIQRVIPTDLSRFEIDFSPIRKSTLPLITPKAEFVYLNFGDSYEPHGLTADLLETDQVLKIKGDLPNTADMHEARQLMADGSVVYEIDFKLSDKNTRELIGDRRLTMAIGVELLDFILANTRVAEADRKIKFSRRQHFILWHTPEEVREDQRFQDPEKTQLSFYGDKVVASSKQAPDIVFWGRRWLVGKPITASNAVYLAQAGSDRWWELNMAPKSTVLTMFVNTEEIQRLDQGSFDARNYSFSRRADWPIWIAHQAPNPVEYASRCGSIDFPVDQWQKAEDFQVDITGDRMDIADNSDPAKMPFYAVFKAFDPLITADFAEKDPAKGLLAQELASVQNMLEALRIGKGTVGKEDKDLFLRIVTNTKKIISDYGGEPQLTDELTKALEAEELL